MFFLFSPCLQALLYKCNWYADNESCLWRDFENVSFVSITVIGRLHCK